MSTTNLPPTLLSPPQPSQRCPRCPCCIPCSGESSKVIATDSSPSTRPGPKPTCTALRSLLAGNLPNWPPFMGEWTAWASMAQPSTPWENDWSLMSPTGFWFRSRKFLFTQHKLSWKLSGWDGGEITQQWEQSACWENHLYSRQVCAMPSGHRHS